MLHFQRDFPQRVRAVITSIPPARVMTYGQVALCAGFPGYARHVGHWLYAYASESTAVELPWQRVVNAQGGMSTEKLGLGDLQQRLLQSEGVVFKTPGKLRLKDYQWWPPGFESWPQP
jgi:methylated-DNA-protein-cysteine methyltransferase related protein